MFIVERLIGGGVHRRMAVPAKSFQRLAHKLLRLVGVKRALFVVNVQQLIAAAGKDIAPGEHGGGALAQLFVFDKLKAQQ